MFHPLLSLSISIVQLLLVCSAGSYVKVSKVSFSVCRRHLPVFSIILQELRALQAKVDQVKADTRCVSLVDAFTIKKIYRKKQRMTKCPNGRPALYTVQTS